MCVCIAIMISLVILLQDDDTMPHSNGRETEGAQSPRDCYVKSVDNVLGNIDISPPLNVRRALLVLTVVNTAARDTDGWRELSC